MRMLASGHWTGDLLRLEAVLTPTGGVLVVLGSSLAGRLIGLGLLVAAVVLGGSLCWLYLRAEEAGDTWDPAEYGAPPLSWRHLRPRDIVVGTLLVLVFVVAEILIRGPRP